MASMRQNNIKTCITGFRELLDDFTRMTVQLWRQYGTIGQPEAPFVVHVGIYLLLCAAGKRLTDRPRYGPTFFVIRCGWECSFLGHRDSHLPHSKI